MKLHVARKLCDILILFETQVVMALLCLYHFVVLIEYCHLFIPVNMHLMKPDGDLMGMVSMLTSIFLSSIPFSKRCHCFAKEDHPQSPDE